MRRVGRTIALVAAFSLLSASTATAATRYAAPGGTGADPCAKPADPCAVYTAADESAPATTISAGDVVELAPGTYRAQEEGEFGYVPPVHVPAGVVVRGEPGKPRPVIVIPAQGGGDGAFYVPAAAQVADLEIRDQTGHGPAIGVAGGTIERVIARSNGPEPTCNFYEGTVRDSACLNSGGGAAIGANVATKGDFEGVIRNSTLIATGPGSVGMEFIFHAFRRGLTVRIDALGALVGGEAKDVVASGLPLNRGRGATVSISLRASRYRTVETEAEDGGVASVTRPGANGNITASPLLAAGNLHQLSGSPTIDRGAVEGAGGSLDVDGEPRSIGAAPDIGADELGGGGPTIDPVPDTRLGARPRSRTPLRIARFSFGSSEPGSRYECKVDRGPYRPCASPFEQKVKRGRHTFRVRAVDPRGQADRTPATLRWRVLPWRRFLP